MNTDLKIDENILYINNKKIEFDYPIAEVIEFATSIVVYIAPRNNQDYAQYNQTYSWKNHKGPVWGYSKKGELLWQWHTGYIDGITRGEMDKKILLPNGSTEKIPCVILKGVGWNFYINTQTGEKLGDEQTK